MKPSFLLFSISLLVANSLFSQSCLPEGIIFKRQSQIDSFPIIYPTCSIIEGNVEINGTDYPIVDLSALSGIQEIRRSLKIINCDSLINLHGLEQLHFIGLYLLIQNNFQLNSIAELNSLDSIYTYIEITDNWHLANLYGLDKIKSLRLGNKIINNHSLKNLNGLNDLSILDGNLTISNDSLINLVGLDSLKTITGNLEIIGNSRLTNLLGLSSLITVDQDLKILSNPHLTLLQGISNLKEIGRSLDIQNNDSLSDCAIYPICQHLLNGGLSNIHNNLHGCNTTDEVVAQCVTATQSPGVTEDLFIFPNPTYDRIDITFLLTYPKSFSFIDLSGKLLKNWPGASSSLDISEFTPGMYILNIQFENQQVNRRVIKL